MKKLKAVKLFTLLVLILIALSIVLFDTGDFVVHAVTKKMSMSFQVEPLTQGATPISNSSSLNLPYKDFKLQIYNYLKISNNRLAVYKDATNLNNGATENTCVYFIGEVYRQNGFNIPSSVSNTSSLISLLKNDGWDTGNNYKNLQPGDLCFTTDEKGNKNGVPSHTYIFMGWQKTGSYDFAYVCDNQAKDYNGMIYHLRNISKSYSVNDKGKDPFSFYMYKQ